MRDLAAVAEEVMWADTRLKVWESRAKLLPHQQRGLSWTATGYGHTPTGQMAKTEPFGPWRRVWCYCVSNSGTCYVKIKGRRHIIDL